VQILTTDIYSASSHLAILKNDHLSGKSGLVTEFNGYQRKFWWGKLVYY